MQVGIDEVGRGCWAGPLLAAAVVLDSDNPIAGLNDSKKLSKVARDKLALLIKANAKAIGIGWVWPADVDVLGLTASVARAMDDALQQVIEQLGTIPADIIIDGNYNFLPQYAGTRTVVGADGLIAEASAASIVAKVARDRYMADVAAVTFPLYGFEKHVGYGTALHMRALAEHGVTSIHRTSYKPIQKFLLQSGA